MTATATLAAAPATLRLYGEIGQEVLAEDVASSLAAAGGRPITVAIFSWGGDAATGLAIHGLLARYSGRVTVVIDGVAASAASLIAMAGDHVVMPEDSLLMAHDPWKIAKGNASSMRSSADLLDAHAASYRQAYARKSGASLEQVAAWMAADQGSGTWFTAQQALAAGLADEVVAPALVRAQAPQMPSGRFSNAPAALAVWATDQVNAQSTQPNTEPMTVQSVQPEASAAELKRENEIRRCAAQAQLSPDAVEALVANGKPFSEVALEIVSAHAAGLSQSPAGHPARINTTNDSSGGLEAELTRALSGARLDQPLWLSLRAAGIGKGNDGPSVWASALAGEGRWLARGSMSTSDLPNLLTSSGNRRLLEKFLVADAGVRIAASVRQLQDYRAAGIIDAGMIGTAKEVKEGGEVTFSSVSEVAATYKPARYALGLSFSPQALSNDDLSALDIAIGELAEAMIDTESAALVDLLEGASLGRNAPDGKALFHADHANVVTPGPIGIQTISSAVEKLRLQKSLGGRYIAQEPLALLVSPGFETTVRQLVSSAVQAATTVAVNPWKDLQVAVEPRLSGSYCYLLGSGRKPLELGRLTSGPVMTTEVDFSTSCYRAKSEHVMGAIVAEHRSIVRLATAA